NAVQAEEIVIQSVATGSPSRFKSGLNQHYPARAVSSPSSFCYLAYLVNEPNCRLRARREPEEIDTADGIIKGVVVRVYSAFEANEIGLDIPSAIRIVVPEAVLEQPRLRIKILARQYLYASPS